MTPHLYDSVYATSKALSQLLDKFSYFLVLAYSLVVFTKDMWTPDHDTFMCLLNIIFQGIHLQMSGTAIWQEGLACFWGLRSKLCAGYVSDSKPTLADHVFMDLAFCLEGLSCWNKFEQGPLVAHTR